MTKTYNAIALDRLGLAFARTFRAYFRAPAVLTQDHDEQLYWLARQLAHEGRQILGEGR
jgi:hypothetical protein